VPESGSVRRAAAEAVAHPQRAAPQKLTAKHQRQQGDQLIACRQRCFRQFLTARHGW
jgi:hypothetical protein